MIGAIDKTDHCKAAKLRPHRRETTLIVLHRAINIDVDKDGDRDFDDVIRFFTADPEGVAITTIGKSYKDLLPIIADWRARGIPATYQGRGFVPYHVLVDAAGQVAQTLHLDVIGAHAGSWANARGIGVAVVSDPRTENPTPAMLASVTSVIAQLLKLYPYAQVVDHDWVNRKKGYPEKGCVGSLFPLRGVVQAAIQLAAGGSPDGK